MTRSLDLARLIEDMDFPSIVFLVAHPGSGRYGCYCHQGVYGVVTRGYAPGEQVLAVVRDWIAGIAA